MLCRIVYIWTKVFSLARTDLPLKEEKLDSIDLPTVEETDSLHKCSPGLFKSLWFLQLEDRIEIASIGHGIYRSVIGIGEDKKILMDKSLLG
jgi:hypothetical protein